jgi:hypothetical protein
VNGPHVQTPKGKNQNLVGSYSLLFIFTLYFV